MPKPPVLNPNVATILQKSQQKTPTVPFQAPQPTVIPNPFAPRPASVSPIPSSVTSESVQKSASVPPPPSRPVENVEKVEKESEPEKPPKPTTLSTSTPATTEIPITPMIENNQQVVSPAIVEVSTHAESSKTAPENNFMSEKVDMSGGLMSWLTKTVTESKLLNDVAEKAKAGMETVITTLDPGMKPFLAEHGVIEFAVFNSDSETLVVASEAFTKSGALAISKNHQFDETGYLANFRPLVLGDQKARQLCDSRIDAARKSKKAVEDAAIVVVQPFLLEISGRFYSTSKVALNHRNQTFDAISQLLEVPSTIVEAIQRAAKSEGLPDDEYSISVSQAIKNVYKSSVNSWEPGSLPPYNSKLLLSLAFSSVAQQLLRNLAPVN
uniref:Uncharacterized protein n=1 Tax=Caenorhabditis japonica TaxID=281687 RepID=A0A8R1EPS5_CAEJA